MTAATQSEIKDRIRTALKEGRHDEAQAMVAAALDRWPDSYWMLKLRTEALVARGDVVAALEDFRAIRERFPDKDAGAPGMVRLLLDHDRLSEARTLFDDEVWRSAVSDEIKSKFITALSPRHGNLDETISFLERLLSARSGDPVVLTRLAVIRVRQGRWDDAMHIFDELATHGPMPEYARAIQADLFLARGRVAEALTLARELAADNPHRVDHTHRLVLALSGSGAHREAAMVLKDAAGKWPGDWRLIFRLNRIVPVQPLWDETFDAIESSFNPASADGRALFQFALSSLRRGKTQLALSVLDAITRRNLPTYLAEPLKNVLVRLSPEDWHGRMRLMDDQAAEAQIVEVDGADTTFMIFGGVDFGFSNLPFGYADALFSAYRANVIYLRDFNARVYFEGISSLAPTAEKTLDRLRAILQRLGTRRLVTMGNSVGGFAAIRYGARLGAEAAISFGAPTTLDAEFEADSSPGVGYSPKALKRALSFRLTEEKDLVKDLQGTTMRVFHYYAGQYPAEVAHAERFRGLANVELRPLDIADHSVALRAISDGLLDHALVDEIGVSRAGLR